MNINIKATNITITPEIHDYFEKKISSLNKLIDMDSDSVYVYAELEKNTHHQNGEVYRAEIKLRSNGHEHYISKDGYDANGAIDLATEGIIEELKTSKEKQRAMSRQGSAEAKDLLRVDGSAEIEEE